MGNIYNITKGIDFFGNIPEFTASAEVEEKIGKNDTFECTVNAWNIIPFGNLSFLAEYTIGMSSNDINKMLHRITKNSNDDISYELSCLDTERLHVSASMTIMNSSSKSFDKYLSLILTDDAYRIVVSIEEQIGLMQGIFDFVSVLSADAVGNAIVNFIKDDAARCVVINISNNYTDEDEEAFNEEEFTEEEQESPYAPGYEDLGYEDFTDAYEDFTAADEYAEFDEPDSEESVKYGDEPLETYESLGVEFDYADESDTVTENDEQCMFEDDMSFTEDSGVDISDLEIENLFNPEEDNEGIDIFGEDDEEFSFESDSENIDNSFLDTDDNVNSKSNVETATTPNWYNKNNTYDAGIEYDANALNDIIQVIKANTDCTFRVLSSTEFNELSRNEVNPKWLNLDDISEDIRVIVLPHNRYIEDYGIYNHKLEESIAVKSANSNTNSNSFSYFDNKNNIENNIKEKYNGLKDNVRATIVAFNNIGKDEVINIVHDIVNDAKSRREFNNKFKKYTKEINNDSFGEDTHNNKNKNDKSVFDNIENALDIMSSIIDLLGNDYFNPNK